MNGARVSVSSAGDLRALRVGDVMTTEPITLRPDQTLAEAVDLMEERGILHFPIVEGDRLVGLLTERCVQEALPSILMLRDPEARRRSLRATLVSKVCVQDPYVIPAGAPLRLAITKMRRHKAGSLPVVNQDRLVGMLTAGDLITVLERILLEAREQPKDG